jgi:D-alanine-D-alanine ligase
MGEDGTIQRLLNLADMPYTGSGATASAVAMDKALTKHICRSLGIGTAPWKLFRCPDGRIDEELHDSLVSEFEPPFIIKPNDSGSTVGLTKVYAAEEITPALIEVLGETTNILAEQYIEGRELTVAILDGRALPVVEIVPAGGLYDYEAKYTKGGSQYFCPAEIDDELREVLRQDAVRLYDTLGCSGVARVDFIVDDKNRAYCLELNTLPGMTELSLVPMAAKAVGIEFPELIERMLRSGLRDAGR